MGKRDDLIAKYASDIQEKCGMKPDMKLLTAVVVACGPAIYKPDAETKGLILESKCDSLFVRSDIVLLKGKRPAV